MCSWLPLVVAIVPLPVRNFYEGALFGQGVRAALGDDMRWDKRRGGHRDEAGAALNSSPLNLVGRRRWKSPHFSRSRLASAGAATGGAAADTGRRVVVAAHGRTPTDGESRSFRQEQEAEEKNGSGRFCCGVRAVDWTRRRKDNMVVSLRSWVANEGVKHLVLVRGEKRKLKFFFFF